MRMMRVREVADRLSCHPATIYRLIANGDFPRGAKLGTKIRIWRESDVEDYVARQLEIAGQKRDGI